MLHLGLDQLETLDRRGANGAAQNEDRTELLKALNEDPTTWATTIEVPMSPQGRCVGFLVKLYPSTEALKPLTPRVLGYRV